MAAGQIDPPLTPSLSALFKPSLVPNNAIGFKQDGVISTIASGSGPASLYSLGELSAATFRVDPRVSTASSPIGTLSSIGPSTLTLTLNDNPYSLSLSLFPPEAPTPTGSNDPAQTLADEINRALAVHQSIDQPLGSMLYASATDGYVTINALGQNTVDSASITGDTVANSAVAAITKKASAAEIDLATREGVQLSGANAIPSEWNTAANGFLSDAMQPQLSGMTSDLSGKILSRSYRNLQITDTQSPIIAQQSPAALGAQRTSSIKVDIAPEARSEEHTSELQSH